MGRIKSDGKGGSYFDPNDDGPDQVELSPEERQAKMGGSSAPAAPAQSGPQVDTAPLPMPDGSYPIEGSKSDDIDGSSLFSAMAEKGGYKMPEAQGLPSEQNTGIAGRGGMQALPPGQNPGYAEAPESALPDMQKAQLPEMQDKETLGADGVNSGGLLNPDGTPKNGNTGVAGGVDRGQPVSATAPAAVGAVPPGFDSTKWNDPNKSDPKYDAGHAVQQNPNITAQEMQALLDKKYPGKYKAYGSDSVVETDTGDIYDFKKGSKEGLNQPQWTGVGNVNGSGGSGDAGGSGGGSSALAHSFGGGDMGSAIARLLGRGEAGTDASDPNIAAATSAFRAQGDASRRRAQVGLAERAAQSGLNTGGSGGGFLDSAIQSQHEQEGRDVGEFSANAVLQEIQSKRQDVVNALNFAQGEERMALQQQLAMLDHELQSRSLDQNNQHFYDDLSYNMGRDASGLDAQMLKMLYG